MKSPNEKGDIASELEFLAEAIANERATVYVGSGASQASGFPSWPELLNELYTKHAKKMLVNDEPGRVYLERLLKERRYLETADLLQDILDQDLEAVLWNTFKASNQPSSIHRNITRMPFRLAMTTNYDRLLESSFPSPRTVLTWQNAHALLRAIQLERLVILKTHGNIGDGPSLILSTRQYRNIMYATPLFREVQKRIFTTKTCLFVGASLTDPDLLDLFHEIITEVGLEAFPVHYALLPESEVPKIRIDNLYNSLRIKIIPFKDKEEDSQVDRSASPPGDGNQGEPDSADSERNCLQTHRPKQFLEQKVSRVLVALSGRVSKIRTRDKPPDLPSSDDAEFYLRDAMARVLEKAVLYIGAFRGDVCLSKDGIGNRLTGKLTKMVSYGPTAKNCQDGLREDLDPSSICGIAYFESSTKYGVYMPEVTKKHVRFSPQSSNSHRGEIKYKPCHSDVRSELAMPIEADGVRVGVLNLESNVENAFSSDHIEAAKFFCDKAGRLFAAAQERKRRARKLEDALHYGADSDLKTLYRDLFNTVCYSSQQEPAKRVKPETLDFLLYRVDYEEGKLESQKHPTEPEAVSTRGTKKARASFCFSDISLATRIFKARSPVVCPDADAAIERKEISSRFAQEEGIKGAIVGHPIYIGGYISGVQVIWFRGGPSGSMDWRHLELFNRVTHLLANAGPQPRLSNPESNPYSAEEASASLKQNIADLCTMLAAIKEASRKAQPTGAVPKVSFFDMFTKVIGVLLNFLNRRYPQASTRNWICPTRCRVWLREDMIRGFPKVPKAVFCYILEIDLPGGQPGEVEATELPTLKNAAVSGWKNVLRAEAAAAGGAAAVDDKVDLYLNFLINRIETERFARIQLPSVFGTDMNAETLNKNPHAPWWVAPILVIHPDKNSDPSPEPKSDLIDAENGTRTLAAYLALDGGNSERERALYQSESNLPQDEEAVSQQSEVLHTLDVFTALIAELFFQEVRENQLEI